MNRFTPHGIDDILSRNTHRSIIPTGKRSPERETSSNSGPSLKDVETLPDDEHPLRTVARDEEFLDGTMPTVSRIETSKISGHSLKPPTFQCRSTDDKLKPLDEFPATVPLLHSDLSQKSLLMRQSFKNVGLDSTEKELTEPHTPMQQSIPQVGNSEPTVNKSLSAHASQAFDGSKSFSSSQQTASCTSQEMKKIVLLFEHSGTDSGIMSHQFLSQQTASGNNAQSDSTTVPTKVGPCRSLESGTLSTPKQNTDLRMVQRTAQPLQSNQLMLTHDQYSSLTNNRVLHCDACPRRKFWSALHLYEHNAVQHPHDKKLKCTKCLHKFVFHYSLRTHYCYNHRDRETYKCVLCSAAFSDVDDFRSHEERTHFGPPRQQCLICFQDFQNAIALDNHMCNSHS